MLTGVVMVAVVESTGAGFVAVPAQVIALWMEKRPKINERDEQKEQSYVMMLFATYSWHQISSERWSALIPFAVSSLYT